nr:AP-1 complex subunit sigma-2-like [Pan paniscus]
MRGAPSPRPPGSRAGPASTAGSPGSGPRLSLHTSPPAEGARSGLSQHREGLPRGHSTTASLPQHGDRGFPFAAAAAAAAAAAGQALPRPRPAAAMQFMLLFSRQGKLRLQKWYVPLSDKEKKKITRELVQTVLARKPKMCSFLEWRDLKIVYKRYASLYFCCAIEDQDNELITLEIIHRYVELLDKYFGSVCELDIIFNFEKAYFILDEFLLGGEVQETSKKNVLKAIEQADLLQESFFSS